MSQLKIQPKQPRPHTGGVTVVRQKLGEELIVSLDGSSLAAPDKSFYADHVQVDVTPADGVRLFFGKRHPFGSGRLRTVLEVSFPHRTFYEHLYRSIVTTEGRVRSFEESV